MLDKIVRNAVRLVPAMMLGLASCGSAQHIEQTLPRPDFDQNSSSERNSREPYNLLEQFELVPWRQAFDQQVFQDCESQYGPFECALTLAPINREFLREYCGGNYFRVRVTGPSVLTEELADEQRASGEEVFEYQNDEGDAVYLSQPHVYVFCKEENYLGIICREGEDSSSGTCFD